MEMDSEDKYGMKRAKDFSEGLRKTCRLIANKKWLVVCSNQERESPNGLVTPGGKGIPYYSSIRIRICPSFKGAKIQKEKNFNGKKLQKVIGIHSVCEIKKSSVDDPYRTAPVSIVFGYGIDDIRDMLQWNKDVTGTTKYNCLDTEIGTMDKAIEYIETHKMIKDLRTQTIDLWEEVENTFKIQRTKKERI